MEHCINQPVHFISHGLECAGNLYLPSTDVHSGNQLPCLILAHGFTGTMDWLLPSYAEQFAIAGMAVLIFDYRYFGQSEGKPRQ